MHIVSFTMKGYIQRMRAVFSQLSDSHSELRDCGPETFRSRCSKSTEDLTSDGEYRAVLVQLTTGAESESRGGREVERRESTRFQSAKNLLKSLRPGHHGWADVTTSPYPDESQNIRPTSEDSLANHYPTLDRRDPHYHSEGKGMKKRKPWTSEKELRTLPSRAEPTSCNIKSSAPKDSISMTDRSQSFQERKRRSSFSSDENVYENMEEQNRNAQGLDQLVRMDRERERRSFRKLTKDSGYETNYAESDYANLESLELSSLNSKDMELGIPTEDYSSVYRSAPQLQERHGESEPGTSNSVLYPQMAALPSWYVPFLFTHSVYI
ncbi:unnamed protein product [Darwinula stevensoni]|uniref:Uncharacterized protein n=1 Tax=Darwinula stevensoni TaxID=69355 RepID=A0A7R8XG22_9CRUS|nr:unnamed protein product [Darwinula stevensoni]CAG0896070.1 unnamed protein product [Darwinula stevensoni]